MTRGSGVAGVQLCLPLVKQFQRRRRVADFVAQIVGNTAIGVDVEKMLAETTRQEPGCYGEVLVVGAGQATTICAGFYERRWGSGNCVGGGKPGPRGG